MKLNTKSRAAVAAMLDIAAHGNDKPVALASIAERQDISASYLELLLSRLRATGLVVSSRGPGGGYRLNKGLSAISIADIANAVDAKPSCKRSCGGTFDCRDGGSCPAHGLWCGLEERLQEYLGTVTLDTVLNRSWTEAPLSLPARPKPQPSPRNSNNSNACPAHARTRGTAVV